jgi:hypothetical protein
MAQLILVRGLPLPGSGKSTWARKFLSEQRISSWKWFEADHFFEAADGSYVFDGTLIGAAHEWCYGSTALSLKNGWNVVVSNTFTTMWELERYVALGKLIPNTTVRVVEIKTQFENVHGVPADKLAKMAARWQDIPQEWINNGLHVEVIK